MREILKATVWIGRTVYDAYHFTVEITAPVPMPIATYKVTLYQLLSRRTSQKDNTRIMFEILTEQVLDTYNKHIENSPILDMIEDPNKYKMCSSVEWTREFSSFKNSSFSKAID